MAKFLARMANPQTTTEQIMESIEKDRPAYEWGFKILDDVLGKQQYVAANEWSLADYLVAAEVSQWGDLSPMLPPTLQLSAYPNIAKYAERIATRAGYAEFVAPWKAALAMIAPKA